MNQKVQTQNRNCESIEDPNNQYTVEQIHLAVKSFSCSNDLVQQITGKCHKEKELSLPMPQQISYYDFGKLIGIPSFIGPKRLLAYKISAVFDISEIMFVSFNIFLREQKSFTKSMVQVFLTLGDNGSDRTSTSKVICKAKAPLTI